MIRILPEAAAEVEDAANFYEHELTGLGERFLNRFQAAVEEVQLAPDMYSPLGEGYRKYGLRPFPYAVIYRAEQGVIVIVAVMHQKRRPNYWREQQ